MSRYQNGKVYKIIAPNDTIYIGSTIQSLTRRFNGHKTEWNCGKILKGTSTYEMFETYGVNNCKIELVEAYPCDSKRDLERHEGEIIMTTNCINQVVAGRTPEEYRRDNSEIRKIKNKERYLANREHLLELAKQYYIENSDKVKERAKEYNRLNQIAITDRRRIIRQTKRENLLKITADESPDESSCH